MQPPSTEPLVCAGCRPATQPRDDRPAREALLEALQIAVFDRDHGAPVTWRGVTGAAAQWRPGHAAPVPGTRQQRRLT